MAQLMASIPDLQREYATHRENCSVREYLTQVKGYTENQYKLIMRHAPVIEWQENRNRVKNNADVAIIKAHIDQHVEVQSFFIKSSRLATAMALKQLSRLQEQEHCRTSSSAELAHCMKAIAIAQQVYNQAMGVGPSDGLRHLYQPAKAAAETAPATQAATPLDQALKQLTYDQISDLIKIKRDRSIQPPSTQTTP